MANLEAKFTELQDQLTTQYTGVQNSLDAILTALGAPPPTPSVTLADIADLLTIISDNLITSAAANDTFYADLLENLSVLHTDMNNQLNSVGIQLDTMNNNNSLNAQRILAMMLSTACACETDTPLLAPPIDVTPTEHVDEAKCRRIQFYLALYGDWINRIASYGSTGANITGGVLGYLLGAAATAAGLTATGAEIGAAAGLPGAVVGAVLGLIIGAIYAFGGTILTDYAAQLNEPTLQDNLLMALYAATNADEGQLAFESVISAEFSPIPSGIFNALWYSTWSNEVYASTPIIDDSAFDGSICIPVVEPECFDEVGVYTDMGGYFRYVYYLDADYLGWSVNVIEGSISVSVYGDGNPGKTIDTTPHILLTENINLSLDKFFFSREGGGYTLHICPPE